MKGGGRGGGIRRRRIGKNEQVRGGFEEIKRGRWNSYKEK